MSTKWDNLNEAFHYLRNHLATKHGRTKFHLSELDLVLVSNFKGGNASIVEPLDTLATKLKNYSEHLKSLEALIDGKTLRDFRGQIGELQRQASNFILLTKGDATKIKGFGPANASALLAAYFTDTLPILDRRVLRGAKIAHECNSQKQVRKIETHYAELIQKYSVALTKDRKVSMRELDRKWFGPD